MTYIEPPPVTVVTRVEEPRPAASVRTFSSPAIGERLDLQGWISRAIGRGATTLYLRAGAPASARLDDRIQPLGDDLVDASVLDEASGAFARGGDGMWQSRSDGEWVREFHDLGNVSCRMFSDHHGFGLVLQMRPHASPRLLHKHIPRQVRTACEGEGLVVVSAPTEAAVESLALALADYSGRTRGGYLISLQRRSLRGDISGAFVSLRTITGPDSEFAAAIRRASHEAPDILLVTGPQTELPLHEAILASTGGRLVIVAVVAPTTVEAVRVLVGQSGLDRDAHLRRALAASFRAAVGYRSLRRIGGGRMLDPGHHPRDRTKSDRSSRRPTSTASCTRSVRVPQGCVRWTKRSRARFAGVTSRCERPPRTPSIAATWWRWFGCSRARACLALRQRRTGAGRFTCPFP